MNVQLQNNYAGLNQSPIVLKINPMNQYFPFHRTKEKSEICKRLRFLWYTSNLSIQISMQGRKKNLGMFRGLKFSISLEKPVFVTIRCRIQMQFYMIITEILVPWISKPWKWFSDRINLFMVIGRIHICKLHRHSQARMAIDLSNGSVLLLSSIELKVITPVLWRSLPFLDLQFKPRWMKSVS